MTTEIGGEPQGRSRWLYGGMIASLAVNLLFVGGFGAAAWHNRHGPRGDDIGLMGFAHELPGDRQKIVRDDIKAARQTIRPLRQAVRDAWDEANKVLTVEPFDKDKYKAAMGKLTEAETQFKSAIAAALAETAAKLTPEERVSLQGWRERRRPHMFGRHGHRDGPGDEGPAKDGAGKEDRD